MCVLWGPMDINAGHSIFGGGRSRRIFILLEWSWLHIPQLLIFVQAGPGRYYSGALIFFLPFIDPHSRWLIDLIGSMDMWKRPRGITESDSDKSGKVQDTGQEKQSGCMLMRAQQPRHPCDSHLPRKHLACCLDSTAGQGVLRRMRKADTPTIVAKFRQKSNSNSAF